MTILNSILSLKEKMKDMLVGLEHQGPILLHQAVWKWKQIVTKNAGPEGTRASDTIIPAPGSSCELSVSYVNNASENE